MEYNFQEDIAPVPARSLLLCGLSQGMAVFSRGRSSMSCRRTICIIMVFLDCRESLTWHLGHLFPLLFWPGCLQHWFSHIFLSLSQSCCAVSLTFPKYTFPEEPLSWLWGWAMPCDGWAAASWNCVWCGAAPVLFSQRPPLQPHSSQKPGHLRPTCCFSAPLAESKHKMGPDAPEGQRYTLWVNRSVMWLQTEEHRHCWCQLYRSHTSNECTVPDKGLLSWDMAIFGFG